MDDASGAQGGGGRTGRFPGVEWFGSAGRFIEVDESKCDGCARCVRVCLAGCFEMTGKKARVATLEECMECASCWFACERGAVSFTWPAGGTGYLSEWG